jgi:hypothetical protein
MIPGLKRRDAADDPLAWLDEIDEEDEWPELKLWSPEPNELPLGTPGRPSGTVQTPDVVRVTARDAEVVADSLQIHVPAGYIRDLNGVWRYSWSARVPRAVDLTPARLVQARHHDNVVAVPVWALRGPLEPLSDHAALLGEWGYIDLALWAACRSRPLGVIAPELAPEMMLDLQSLSALLGYLPGTVRNMHSRGSLPPPQRVLGRTPLWARPVVERWIRDTHDRCAGRSKRSSR